MRHRYAIRWSRVPETLALAASIAALVAVVSGGSDPSPGIRSAETIRANNNLDASHRSTREHFAPRSPVLVRHS